MRNYIVRVFLFIIFCIHFCITYGGGFYIDRESVRFNGYPCEAVFPPGQRINMTYVARHYSFSGGSQNYEYIVFKIVNTTTKKSFTLLQLARDYIDKSSTTLKFSLNFQLPQTVGTYTVTYYKEPLFSPFAYGVLEPNNSIQLADRDLRQIEIFSRNVHNVSLCAINVHAGVPIATNEPAIYLQVNKKLPSTVKMNDAEKEIEFAWSLSNVNRTNSHQYRYRLYPDEEWSLWQTDKYVKYYLINKGIHEFQVECRYLLDEKERVTPVAQFSFTLEKPFLGTPEDMFEYRPGDEIGFTDKGEIRQSTKKPKEIIGRLYDRSTALLIGVDSYDDPSFGILPYVRNDINAVSNTFTRMGFTIKNPTAKKKNDIMTAIRTNLVSMGKNDRLVIYISSHGFLDPFTSRPLIAAKDCNKRNGTDAIAIDEIKSLIQGSNMKGRHVLLILDCCTSGVGVMDKTAGLAAVRTLATRRGSHILTAGMADQNARMYEDLHMSVFTHYLVKGLSSKDADYTKDGVITLSELLIYVQYHVASYTGSAQIPMSGRINGYGEIIF